MRGGFHYDGSPAGSYCMMRRKAPSEAKAKEQAEKALVQIFRQFGRQLGYDCE